MVNCENCQYHDMFISNYHETRKKADKAEQDIEILKGRYDTLNKCFSKLHGMLLKYSHSVIEREEKLTKAIEDLRKRYGDMKYGR